MNTEPIAGDQPAVTEAAASAYIAAELPKAQTALRRTRIVGGIAICLVGIYIAVISVTMVKFFQPRAAAEVASGMIIGQLANHGPTVLREVEREIPVLVRQIPDYVIQEVPHYRQDVEQAMEKDLRTHCVVLSQDVGRQMDKLIEDSKLDMNALLANANNPAALRKLLPDLDQMITEFLTTNPDGKQINQHISDLAAELHEIQQRTDRLANGSNLSVEEQKARHSLAILSRAIKNKLDAREPAPAKKLVQN